MGQVKGKEALERDGKVHGDGGLSIDYMKIPI